MYDLIVIGSGLGGCAAALAACEQGLTVLMTEETDWIGGQSTTQAVPPDEHRWIEEFGCTSRYRKYRDEIRAFYLKNFKLFDEANKARFNPGDANVSGICHDPRVSLFVLQEMLSPYLLTGQLTIMYESIAKSVSKKGKREIQTLELLSVKTGECSVVSAPFYIDATEAGDVLPIAGVEYVTGSESKSDTQEPHATEQHEPNNIQGFTYVLALEYDEDGDHVIPEPEMYHFWKTFKPDIWPNELLSLIGLNPVTLEKREYGFFTDGDKFSLWKYRRVYAKDQFVNGANEITLLNWPQNDYFLGNVYDVSEEEKEKHLHAAQQLSLSLVYWLQTEAPRPDGKVGYPGLKLRGDVLGTTTGFAKAPYIRESRRIKGLYRITEHDVSPSVQTGKTGKLYGDRVGVGSYSIDLHPSMSGVSYVDIPALPYHIPLGALIPQDMDNLLAGCKNISTTHITNGCYRLHPTEWNIGEVCGELVAYCLKQGTAPAEVRGDSRLLQDFQDTLRHAGVQLEWPESFYQ